MIFPSNHFTWLGASRRSLPRLRRSPRNQHLSPVAMLIPLYFLSFLLQVTEKLNNLGGAGHAQQLDFFPLLTKTLRDLFISPFLLNVIAECARLTQHVVTESDSGDMYIIFGCSNIRLDVSNLCRLPLSVSLGMHVDCGSLSWRVIKSPVVSLSASLK